MWVKLYSFVYFTERVLFYFKYIIDQKLMGLGIIFVLY